MSPKRVSMIMSNDYGINIFNDIFVGKRKSKWDQQSVDGKLVQSSSSGSSQGKAPTVINAFGNLKKPKI